MKTTNTILVTGGAGFIGSNFILDWLALNDTVIVNLDALTYAGNLENLESVAADKRHVFVQGNIGDKMLVSGLLNRYRPYAIINFAAESHVDRSIISPEVFVETNVVATSRLLETSLNYWRDLDENSADSFRFLHVSTDEVYGSLDPDAPAFTENKRYEPNSPYSASKAASDHFVRSFHHTYGLPVITTNCSNNYGPFQFPEKMIPLMITNALAWKSLPVYGDGMNIRDWLYVTDHCTAIRTVLEKGRTGQTYNIGGRNEMANIDIVRRICDILDHVSPSRNGKYESLITFVKDRPGHDRRYAINTGKIESELGWFPGQTFDSGITRTVEWYCRNPHWVSNVMSGAYREWIAKNYQER